MWTPILTIEACTRDRPSGHHAASTDPEQLVARGLPPENPDGDVELFTAEEAGHGFFNRPPWYAKTLESMEAFFVRTLRG